MEMEPSKTFLNGLSKQHNNGGQTPPDYIRSVSDIIIWNLAATNTQSDCDELKTATRLLTIYIISPLVGLFIPSLY